MELCVHLVEFPEYRFSLALFGQYFLLKIISHCMNVLIHVGYTRPRICRIFASVAPHCADTQYYEVTVVVWL